MTQTDKMACIFGGSGFIGKQVTQELARAGYRIKIATRIPENAFELKTCGNVGQVVPFQCDYKNPESINAAIANCDVVINLVGIVFEKRKNRFMRIHCDIPENIAKACAQANIKKFIHVSALGVDKAKSKYAASKLAGEDAISKEFPNVTILRPSVVFGAGDSFFNMFAKMASFSPVLPLIGGGKTKFQPVYVGDIAEAITNIANDKVRDTAGKTFELGGPQIVNFKEIYELLLTHINRERRFVSIPWFAAKMQGLILGLMPKPLLTCDQVKTLKTDNVIDENALKLSDLGVETTAMCTILPRYLSNFKKGGPFCDITEEKHVKKAA